MKEGREERGTVVKERLKEQEKTRIENEGIERKGEGKEKKGKG